MTCVAAAIANDAVHLFADSAVCGPTGNFVSETRKIAMFPRARCAVVVRGSIIHVALSRLLGFQCKNFAQVRDRARSALCGPWGIVFTAVGPFELYLAGVGSDGAPALCMIVSHRKHAGVAPRTLIEGLTAVTTGPVPKLDPSADPVAWGTRAAQLQRAVRQRLPFARSPVSIVGGCVRHVTVDARGVRSETLGGWSDRFGEKLDPSAKFSTSGAKVQRATRRNFVDWILPTSPLRLLRTLFIVQAAFSLASLAAAAPAIAYLEFTYHGAPSLTVATAAGSWDVYTRLDAGKLITSPSSARGVSNALTGRKSTPGETC